KQPHDLAVSPCGGLVAAACGGDGLKVALGTGRDRARRLTSHSVLHVDFTPDGRTLLASGEGVDSWPVEREAGGFRIGPRRRLWDRGRCLQVAREGKSLAVGTGSGSVMLLDLESGAAPVKLGDQPSLSTVSIGPRGEWVAAGIFGGKRARVFDARRGGVVHEYEARTSFTCFSPDGRWLALSLSSEAQLLETGTWRAARAFPREEGGELAGELCFTPDGRFLFASVDRQTVACIDVASGSELARLGLGQEGDLHCLSFAEAGFLAFAYSAGWVKLFDLAAIQADLAELGLEFAPARSARAPSPPPAGGLTLEEPAAGSPAPDREPKLFLLVESDRSDPESYARRGDEFLASGRLHDALADYGRALERKPRSPAPVLRRRADCLVRLRRWEEALADLDESLRLEPESVETLLLRARCHDLLAREIEAIRDLEEILRRSPDHAEAMDLLAWTLLVASPERRDPARAFSLARKAAAALPRSYGARRTLGVIFAKRGLHAEARVRLEEALLLPGGRDSPSTRLFLALARAGQGDLEGARQAYTEAEALLQRFDAAPTARERLEGMFKEARAELPASVVGGGE
ncbi:MAG: WD40 repeat domain-containing protein, partial [Thermoanaerobaculia bacterium]